MVFKLSVIANYFGIRVDLFEGMITVEKCIFLAAFDLIFFS